MPPPQQTICGVYGITCKPTGKLYIGSSVRIKKRWWGHKKDLNRGTSGCVLLQHAWNKYGEDAFEFYVVEECPAPSRKKLEQWYVSVLGPELNCLKEISDMEGGETREKLLAFHRRRSEETINCPRGHAYDESNNYRDKNGWRKCRVCAKEKMRERLEHETPEEGDLRRRNGRIHYHSKSPATPEQREARLVWRRAYYSANREKLCRQLRDNRSSRREK